MELGQIQLSWEESRETWGGSHTGLFVPDGAGAGRWSGQGSREFVVAPKEACLSLVTRGQVDVAGGRDPEKDLEVPETQPCLFLVARGQVCRFRTGLAPKEACLSLVARGYSRWIWKGSREICGGSQRGLLVLGGVGALTWS